MKAFLRFIFSSFARKPVSGAEAVGPAPVPSPSAPAPSAPFMGRAIRIGQTDIARAAMELGCDVAAIKAVLVVETGGGSGFLPDGRPKILFEAHLFSRETQGRFDYTHPRVSSPVTNRLLYVGGAGEYPRLAEAVMLDRKAALRSASWGLFQILGSNHQRCGYPTVDAFVDAMCDDEANHLDAFLRFCRAGGLDRHLRARDWGAFARGYNGPAFAQNKYDQKLAAAYVTARGT